MQKYVFREHKKEYRKFFQEEEGRIAKALKGFSEFKIEHVGSTAIEGLGGKGIIDIAVGVLFEDFSKAKEELEKFGYEFRQIASTPERLFFRADYAIEKETRRVHLHLVELNGRDWKEMVDFRDYLLSHPKIIKRYAEIKKGGVDIAEGDGQRYRNHKKSFIEEVLNNIN